MSALFCGLDVHKESTYATILDSDGKMVSQRRMVNERILPYLSEYRIDRIGMEASNQVAPLYRELRRNGYDVLVSHPKKTRYIAEARIKSDRVDSKAIAELVRLDALPSAYMPPRDVAELREKVRRRAFLVRERTKLRVKVRSILTYEGIKLPSSQGLFTEKGVEWLHSLGLEPVESYIRVIEVLDAEIKQLSRHFKGLAGKDEEVTLLMTIPGVGYYTALLVKSEIGDLSRFSDGDRLCSYAGLVPSTHASGGTVRHGGITREGSRWLRWVMVEAAMTHVHKYDTAITRSYHRIAERRGRQVATVAAARRLLMCCYSVLKNKRPYHDQA
jgi:transposase